MNYPTIVGAARKLTKDLWSLADAMVTDIPAGVRNVEGECDEAAAELRELGIVGLEGKPYGAAYLRKLRDIARKFPPENRRLADGSPLAVTVAREAGTPQVLAKAEAIASEDGVNVSSRLARKVRNAVNDKVKKAERKKPKPERKKQKEIRSSANDVPVSTARRQVNVLAIADLAVRARKAATQFIEKISGADLTDDEREELLHDVDRALEAWKVARAAVQNPLSREIEKFLEGV